MKLLPPLQNRSILKFYSPIEKWEIEPTSHVEEEQTPHSLDAIHGVVSELLRLNT
jgi:hypothetical protein